MDVRISYQDLATVVYILFPTHVGWPVSTHFVCWRVFAIAFDMPRRECQAAPEEFGFSIGLWHNRPPVLAAPAVYRHRITSIRSMLMGAYPSDQHKKPGESHAARSWLFLLVLDSGYPRVWLAP